MLRAACPPRAAHAAVPSARHNAAARVDSTPRSSHQLQAFRAAPACVFRRAGALVRTSLPRARFACVVDACGARRHRGAQRCIAGRPASRMQSDLPHAACEGRAWVRALSVARKEDGRRQRRDPPGQSKNDQSKNARCYPPAPRAAVAPYIDRPVCHPPSHVAANAGSGEGMLRWSRNRRYRGSGRERARLRK